MPRLDHVAFEDDDPDGVATFYERFLGARLVHAEGHPPMAYLDTGAFAFHKRGGPGAHLAIRMAEDERLALKQALDEAGVQNEERDHEIAVGLFFEDPSGRRLEAITYRSGNDPRRPQPGVA